MARTVNIHEVKTHLSRLLEEVRQGEEVVIAKAVTEQISRNVLEVLPIHLRHALVLHALPDHHRDPFDRLLIAQAAAENVAILTADPLMTRYPIQTVW